MAQWNMNVILKNGQSKTIRDVEAPTYAEALTKTKAVKDVKKVVSGSRQLTAEEKAERASQAVSE